MYLSGDGREQGCQRMTKYKFIRNIKNDRPIITLQHLLVARGDLKKLKQTESIRDCEEFEFFDIGH